MQSKRDHLRVGVTGGIGAGKSLVCDMFRRRGRIVLSADRIAREVMESDRQVRGALKEILGPDAYTADGAVNVPVVSRLFAQARLRARINAAVHPAVIREIHGRIDALDPAVRRPYVIVEAALIYESGMDESLDAVIVVDAPEDIRLRRLVERDGIPPEEAARRLKAQMPAEKKRAKADFVVFNSGPENALEIRIAFLDTLLARLAV